MVLGTPTTITAVSDPDLTGVDAQTSILLQHAGGSHAVLTTSLEARSAVRATIVGTEAPIEIDSMFFRPTSFSCILPDGTIDRHEHTPVAGLGLRYEAAEVGRCIRAGLQESPAMPLAESVQVMETLDEIRRQGDCDRLVRPYGHSLGCEHSKPLPEAEFRRVEVVPWGLVQGLQERGLNEHAATGNQNAVELGGGDGRIPEVLEDVEGHREVEYLVLKRQMMSIPYQVGVPVDGCLQLHANRPLIPRTPAPR